MQALGHHEDDRVADVAHPAARQHGVRGHRHPAAVLALDRGQAGDVADSGGFEVARRVDRKHARHGRRLGGVDFADLGMGVGAAQDIAVGLARGANIVAEAALTAQQTRVLDARHALTDTESSHRITPTVRANT